VLWIEAIDVDGSMFHAGPRRRMQPCGLYNLCFTDEYHMTGVDRIPNRRGCVAIAAAAGGIAFCLGIAALPADADAAGVDPSDRSGRWEIMLGPQYTFERNLNLEVGTTANIDVP
jgi:hypothetical protein